VKEMEEEAEKLKDMQKEIEGSLNLSMSPTNAGMKVWKFVENMLIQNPNIYCITHMLSIHCLCHC
jgi:hypothetical protein